MRAILLVTLLACSSLHVSASNRLTSWLSGFGSEEPPEASESLLAAARLGTLTNSRVSRVSAAELNEVDDDGNTALIWASYNGHAPVVELLLTAGVEVDARNHEGNTALIAATFTGQNQVVEMLLGSGANLEGTNNNGDTPLIGATFFGQAATVKLLLQRGALAAAVNGEGKSAYSLAASRGHVDIVSLLEDALKVEAKAEMLKPVQLWTADTVRHWLSLQNFPAVDITKLGQALGAAGVDGEALVLLKEHHFITPACTWAGLCDLPVATVLKTLNRIQELQASPSASPSPPVSMSPLHPNPNDSDRCSVDVESSGHCDSLGHDTTTDEAGGEVREFVADAHEDMEDVEDDGGDIQSSLIP